MMKGATRRAVMTKNDIGSPTNFRHISHNGQLLTDDQSNTDPYLLLSAPRGSQPTCVSTTHVTDSVTAAKRKAPLPPTNQTTSSQSDSQPVPHSFSDGDLLNLDQTPSLAPQRKARLPPLANEIASSQPITRPVPHSTSEGDLLSLNTTPRLSPQRKAPLPPSTNQISTNQQVILRPSSSAGNLLDSNTTPQKKPPPRPPPPRFSEDKTTSTNTTNHVTSMLAMTAMTTFKLFNTHLEDDASDQQQVDTLSDQACKSASSDATEERVAHETKTDVTEEERNEAEEALGAIEELDAILLRFSADSDDDPFPPSQHVNHTASRATGGVSDGEEASGLDDDPTTTTTTTTLSTVGLDVGPENVAGECTTHILPARDAVSNNVTDRTDQEQVDIMHEGGSHPSGMKSELSSSLNKFDSFVNVSKVDPVTQRDMCREDEVERGVNADGEETYRSTGDTNKCNEVDDSDDEKVMIEGTRNSDEKHLRTETEDVTAQEEPVSDPEVNDLSSTADVNTTSSSSDVTTPGSEVDADSAAPRPSVLNWDPQKCLRLEEIEDPELRLLLEKAGVSNDVLEDPGTRDFIYEFIQLHGGKKAVRQEALLLAGLPASTLRRIRKKKKKKGLYSVGAPSVEEDDDNMSTYL